MKSPAFQFYVKEWLSSRSIKLMDSEQRGWYIMLLCEAWQSIPQCSLPNDKEILWKLAGASDETTFNRRCIPVLSNFYERDGLLFNARLEVELKKQADFRKHQSLAGKKSAEKRKRTLTGVENRLPSGSTEHSTEGQPESNSASASAFASANKEEEEPSAPNPLLSKEPKTQEEVPPNRKRCLTDLWCQKYKETFGVQYKFEGPKDGRAADELLKMDGYSNEDLVSVAQSAWKNQDPKAFWSKQAATLSGFSSKFNNIRLEVGLKPKGEKVWI